MACKFDQLWIENRLRYRPDAKGTAMKVDDVTGYLEPATRRGFSGEAKAHYIRRWSVCSNMRAICKSLNVDQQSVYDAICLDAKFRADFLKHYSNTKRSKQLNNEMEKLAISEKTQVILDLSDKLDQYK